MGKTCIYQLKISLDRIHPSIWRRIQVPGDISLLKLHFVLQLAMGWTNSHLHEYIIDGKYYGDPEDDELGTRDVRNERDYQLQQAISTTGVAFSYLYDFGDSWQHSLVVEEILDNGGSVSYPACLDGARACPPEDVGGVYGYEEFLAAIRDPRHPEHDGYLNWAGGKFDPEAFDREQVDAEIKNFERSEMVRVYRRYYSDEVGPELKLYQSISRWIEGLGDGQCTQLRKLPLRRDTVTLLTYLNENKISGTQATGNLPLKAIREVTPDFVHPPVLEEKIGNRIRKIRSEDDVWSLSFIHTLLQTGGLITGGLGRRLNLTRKGLQFLDAEPGVQVWFLLESWWFHTNWLIAYPISGMGNRLPYDFQYVTLHQLLTYETGETIEYERFTDRLIKTSGLKWTAPDMSYARRSLETAIERMVINILADFGAVQREMGAEWIGSHRFDKLVSFALTELGQGLLKAIAGEPF